jgi:tripartite-type tricarboxylate transporter receptor subunit TctC
MCKKLILGLYIFLSMHVWAQEYPNRTISLIVAYPPGGATDIVARTLAEVMSRDLGQTIIVDNKPGASGIIGTTALVNAAPDGYTMMLGITQSVLSNKFLFPKLPYDPSKQLTYISQIAQGPVLLLVPTGSPIKTVNDLYKLASNQANNTTCGSWGIGSSGHMMCSYMAQSWKAPITHVAYKGEAPMMQDLAGNQLTYALGSLLTAKPLMESGKVRIVAVLGDKSKNPSLMNVPTFAEAGFPDSEFKTNGWFCIVGPAHLPKAIIKKWETAVLNALKTPEIQKRFDALALEVVGNTSEQFTSNYSKELPVWQKLIKDSGATLE